MISQSPEKIIVDQGGDKIEINQTYSIVSPFKPISDGGYEQRFVSKKVLRITIIIHFPKCSYI